MKLCKLEDIKPDSILAKPVMTVDYQVLLGEGTILREEYIEKLREIGILEVYIDDRIIPNNEEILILKKDIEESVKIQVKSVLEKHTYSHNQELESLNTAADNVISDIVSKDEVIEQVFDVKERSADLYEHSLNLCTLSVLTAIKLGFSDQQVHDIGVGSLLHDIGLRYLTIDYSDYDLNKMSSVERTEYKKHPVYGYTALKKENWISECAKNIILYHHEHMDGTGYPLKATDIPIEARVVSICDTFDEMICGIGCKRVKVYEAIEYLKTFKNSKFDGKIVDAFINFIALYPAGTIVKTSEGEVGIVIRQNKDFPDRPIIKIIKDKTGNQIFSDMVKDLVDINNIFIEEVLE